MILWILKRGLQSLPVVWGVVTLVFLLLHIVPGDPLDILLGENALPASREAMRAHLHLNEPLVKQYQIFCSNLLHASLGESISQHRPVLKLIAERLPATLWLAVLSLAFACGLAIPAGLWLATKRNSWIEQGSLIVSLAMSSIPVFWLGPLLVLFFSVKLGLFPVSEQSDASSYVLPTLTLGLALSGFILRMTRASALEVLGEDYIVTAHSKGLSPLKIFATHVLKNALLPVLSVLGLQLGSLLSGAVIVESIFDWPGIGELLRNAILARDYPLVQGCVLTISLSYLLVNTLVDILYTWANPRVQIT